MSKITTIQLFKSIHSLVEQSRQGLATVINTTLCETNFHIGRLIIEFEQQGSSRAGYAKETLLKLSHKLSGKLGWGYSVDNLENMRNFYLSYKDDYAKHIQKNQKSETLSRKLHLSPFGLSWSHYIFLISIENIKERKFYEIESLSENWSLRELKRQYNSALFERLILSRNKAKVRELSKMGHVINQPSDVIKDPYVLEFLNLKHQDLYQPQMYVNYFDEEIKAVEENKTIGIILCKNKKESTIKYTLGKDNKQIFASKYKMYFPEKQILKLINAQ
ncbi:MAG TPA: PDDEXK nuclease domain-containing protein [Ferruginibacter sp.]|nr:PDDEXK nuclease domain-containing protein [Ferruginibacter sp.]